MLNTSFREWLLDQEFKRLVEAVVYSEANPDQAAIVQNNMQFKRMFGIEKNWFGIILAQASRFAKGGDISTVASQAATEMLMSLHQKDPSDKFYAGVEQIMSLPEEQRDDQLTAYFTNAAMMRVRRFAGEYQRKRDNMTVHMSSLERKGTDSQSSVDNIEDDREPADAEQRMDSLRRAIMMELERDRVAAKDPRTQKRLELAKAVAEKRWENPPEFPSLEELMGMFPDIKKGTMFNILQDIQAASMRAAQSKGVNTAGLARQA